MLVGLVSERNGGRESYRSNRHCRLFAFFYNQPYVAHEAKVATVRDFLFSLVLTFRTVEIKYKRREHISTGMCHTQQILTE